MNWITASAHIPADASRRPATSKLRSLFARVVTSLISTVIRNNDDDIAEGYEGRSWCDQTEHDLNYDAITGRRGTRP